MGEIAVLRPQDPLKDRLAYNRHNTFVNSSFPSPKSKKTSSSSSSSNHNHGSDKSNRRKRSPQKNSRNSNTSRGGCASLSSSPPAKNRHLVMGQVKILKRGEALTVSMKDGLEKKMVGGEKDMVGKKTCATENDDFALSTTDRLGPEPDMVPKQVKIADFYAGSAFISSPPPSSLPVPAFFKKKIVLAASESYDDASSGLRRLLRLDPS